MLLFAGIKIGPCCWYIVDRYRGLSRPNLLRYTDMISGDGRDKKYNIYLTDCPQVYVGISDTRGLNELLG